LNRSQKFHITDNESAPILSTNPDSAALTSLSQALVTSNSAIEHLGLGRIKGVHAHYVNGEVVQTAKLEGKTGVVATVTGKSVRRSIEVLKIVNVVHGALEGNEEREQVQTDGVEASDEERSKNIERGAHWEVLGSG
jgi:hypothetical protein